MSKNKHIELYEKYRKYLPSKQVGIFMGGTLSVIVLIFVGLKVKGVDYTTKNLQVSTVGQAVAQDTDGDSVPDWEERLFGTNPKSSDSDSDGVPDATEIANKKDIIAAENGYDSRVPYTFNETDKFARDLFVTYSAVSDKGIINQGVNEQIASAAAAGSLATLPEVNIHSAADLKIIPSTKDSNLEYKKRIAALSQSGGGKMGAELAIINRGIEENNGDILRDAAKSAKYYSTFESALLKIPVPQNQVDNHIRLVNNLAYIASVLPYIDTLESDVVRGISLYTVYTKSYKDMFGAFEAIGKTQ